MQTQQPFTILSVANTTLALLTMKYVCKNPTSPDANAVDQYYSIHELSNPPESSMHPLI